MGVVPNLVVVVVLIGGDGHARVGARTATRLDSQ